MERVEIAWKVTFYFGAKPSFQTTVPDEVVNELVIYKDGKFLLDHEDGQSTFDSPHFSLEVIGTLKDNPALYNDGFRISFDSSSESL